MREETRKGLLKWYIEFANLDLGAATGRDKNSMVLDIYAIHNGMADILFTSGAASTPPEIVDPRKPLQMIIKEFNEKDLLREYQDRINELLGKIADSLKEVQAQAQKGKAQAIKLKPVHELGTLNFPIEIKIRTPFIEYVGSLIEPDDSEISRDNLFGKISTDQLINTPIHISYRTDEIINGLLFHLCQVIEGYPIGAIKTCNECGKWYFHNSRRERLYCSNKCGIRVANRNRRKKIKEKNPKKYKEQLKAGSKRSRESYEKKIDKQLGVVPDRRPWKYTEDK